MNFRHIEIFFAVMTCGTVTEAARQLGVSQPSVTTTIQHAEKKLGIQLFRRESGRLVPTQEAMTLFEEAERAHEALSAFNALAARLKVGVGGHVRVACVPSISLELLPDAIAYYLQRYKGFKFSVSTLNTEEFLHQLNQQTGAYHVGFSFGNVTEPGFACQTVGNADLLLIHPSSWNVSGDPYVGLEALKDKPYIAPVDSTPVGQVCSNLFADVEAAPKVVARVHTHHLAGRLVQRGLGFAILDAVTVRALLHDQAADAITVRRINGDPGISVTAIHGSRRGLSNPVRLFIECFEQSCAALNESLGEFLP